MWGTVGFLDGGQRAIRFIPTCVGNGAIGNSRARNGRGSSPRVWGTVGRLPAITATIRFIPTCVGNGAIALPPPGLPMVHPHVCGERRSGLATHMRPGGSSPRVWGTGLCLRVHGHTVRFIPTCVGNGPSGTQGRPCGMVHPHVCGERRGARGGDCCPGGSSPRVWGTEPSLIGNQIGRRFIPTCVGNGSLLLPQRDLLSVHPHVCGERRSTGPMMRLGFGSSPRVWGTVLKNNQDSCDQRFIPTCVGNGESRRLPLPAWAVHPHVCG